MMPAESDVIDHSFARIARRLPEIYLAVALLVSTALCLLTPPFYVPDESNHAQREIEISRGELIAKRTAEGVGAPMDGASCQWCKRCTRSTVIWLSGIGSARE